MSISLNDNKNYLFVKLKLRHSTERRRSPLQTLLLNSPCPAILCILIAYAIASAGQKTPLIPLYEALNEAPYTENVQICLGPSISIDSIDTIEAIIYT